jgi:hypothetical protein
MTPYSAQPEMMSKIVNRFGRLSGARGMLQPMVIEKGGLLAFLRHDLRRVTNDQDLVAVCLFASLGLTAALTLAFLWPPSAEAWVDALAN